MTNYIGNSFSLQMLDSVQTKIVATPVTLQDVKQNVVGGLKCMPRWDYNKYGHVLIKHCDCSEQYIQGDIDVEEFFKSFGWKVGEDVSPGDGDEFIDDDYFDRELIPESGCVYKLKDDVIWGIGHKDTASIVSKELLNEIKPENRINIKLKHGDTLFINQFVGGRLPEGAIDLPPGCEMKWWKVQI